MSWRENLQPASFRGIPFKIKGTDQDRGRRFIRHEFPGADLPYHEKQGLKTKEFTVDAYVIGDDYDSQRDKLLTATELDTPGILVHPNYGSLNVVCMGVTVRETSDEGGIAHLQIKFEVSGEKKFPSVSADPVSGALTSIENLQNGVATKFNSTYSIIGKAQNVTDAARAKANAILAKSVQTQLAAKRLNASLDSIIQTPSAVVASVTQAIKNISGAQTTVTGGLASLFGLFSFGSSDPVLNNTSPEAASIEQNNRALNRLVQASAIATASSLAIDSDFETRQDAEEVRTSIIDGIDSMMEDEEDEDLFNSFADLKKSLFESLPDPNQNIADLQKYAPESEVPILLISHELYGSIDRVEEILKRNVVINPCFISPDQVLEVLSND